MALKRVAKDLVQENMLKESEDILKEMKQGGGIIVQRSGKGLWIEQGGVCRSYRKRMVG